MRIALALLVTTTLAAQEWRSYGGDPGGSKYSSLRQIDRTNVARLKVAWTYRTGDVNDGKSGGSRTAFEATPLLVDSVLYVTTPYARLIALDPETGRELWAFDPKIDRDRPYNLLINRGPAFWTDGKEKRLFV